MCTNTIYGIDAIDINNNVKQAISKAWNWAIRAVFGLRRRERTRWLFKYCTFLSADYKIDLCQLNFLSFLKSVQALNYSIHDCLIPNMVRIILIYLLRVKLLNTPTYYVLIMQCGESSKIIVLIFFE